MADDIHWAFGDLFVGRDDVYGSEHGSCIEGLPIYDNHLHGDGPIGIYPLVETRPGTTNDGVWYVHWGCVDFDEGEDDSWVYAQNLRLVLETFGVTGWVERSRSKGYHVWVFLETWMPAEVVREALLAATQIAGAPTKEINPKQTWLAPEKKGYGNYVRLPYPKDRNWERRCMIRPNGALVTLKDFVADARANRAGIAELEHLQQLYVPPTKSKPPLVVNPVDLTGDVMKRLDGLSFTILTKGPKERLDGSPGDRSEALFAMANSMLRGGTVSREEAWELMIQGDLAWGKFLARGDEAELLRTFEKVWGDEDEE